MPRQSAERAAHASQDMPKMPMDTPTAPCKQAPGRFRPVIDRNRCEGKAACVPACPFSVLEIGTLPKQQRSGLSLVGKLKGFAHRWQQAHVVKGEACEACGHCIAVCPEDAIKLELVR
jgi:4Fe-4S ferredoxin